MKLITKEIEKKLIKQYEFTLKNPDINTAEINKPYLKLFGGSSFTWLLSEYDKANRILFGLCDLGHGGELGYVSLDELEQIKFPPFGLGIERDRFFDPQHTLWEYYKKK
tara:strand:- start:3582 stop:3908 length:327 start_codon:yes stop_codon:yes gene_type:complete